MRMTRKTMTIKLNRRRRDPYAASLRGFRGICFDEKRIALQTLQAWADLREWQASTNDDRDLDEDEY
jgi:hypothetical protein